jgi:integrase
MWLEATRAAGFSVTIHDLRHVHGQWAINAGVPESKVQSSLRHKSASMTRDYVMQRDTGDVSRVLADLVTAKPQRRRA